MIKFNIAGTKITVNFWFFVNLAVLITVGVDAVSLLAAITIHEAGHIVTLIFFGGSVKSIRFSPFGALITPLAPKMLTHWQDAAIVAAGPLFGLAAALAATLAGNREFATLNLGLSLFNLLPIRGLDGKSLLNCFRALKQKTR